MIEIEESTYVHKYTNMHKYLYRHIHFHHVYASKLRSCIIICFCPTVMSVCREILDELNMRILKERMEMKLNKAHHQRLHTLIVDINQGAAGLCR